MSFGYRAILALTSLLVLSGALAAANRPHRRHRTAKAPAAPIAAQDVYSRRALRQARIILQLKLLELRSERLERVREALERRVPIDRLLNGP